MFDISLPFPPFLLFRLPSLQRWQEFSNAPHHSVSRLRLLPSSTLSTAACSVSPKSHCPAPNIHTTTLSMSILANIPSLLLATCISYDSPRTPACPWRLPTSVSLLQVQPRLASVPGLYLLSHCFPLLAPTAWTVTICLIVWLPYYFIGPGKIGTVSVLFFTASLISSPVPYIY